MSTPPGYLGAQARITSGPARQLIEAGYAAETADAALLHDGLGLADLTQLIVLHRHELIPEDPARALAAELLDILETPAADFPYDVRYGDAYNSRERELERRLGADAGWLPAGRTRREAGRIAFRLALRNRLLALHDAVADFVIALCDKAAEHADTVWADNTYLQPAQPSTFGHYVGAFAEEANRHLDRIRWAYRLTDRSPAGAGGVGGSRTMPDRHEPAELLGFGRVGAHTRDVMWSVDGAVDAVLAATHAATTADRLAEDLEIFASSAFGYVTLDASLCRASVLLPQKRNPYALAVIRSGANVLLGRSSGMLATARTPSARTDNWLHTYHEVTDSVDRARRLVALAAEVVRTLRINRQALRRRAGYGFTCAADLAEQLMISASLDYRTAYRIVGRAVADALDADRDAITAQHLDTAAREILGRPLVHAADAETLAAATQTASDPERIVATRTALGGSAPARVREHATRLIARTRAARRWQSGEARKAADARIRLIALAKSIAYSARE